MPTASAPSLQWSFTLAVPLSKIKDTIATLTTVQQNVAKKNNGFSVSFSLQGAQVSPQAQQSQTCALPDLIADARAQAQKLADAAGMGCWEVGDVDARRRRLLGRVEATGKRALADECRPAGRRWPDERHRGVSAAEC